MENTDSDGEDGSAALHQNQTNRLVQEENFYEFVNNLSEEDYKLMRDNDLLGIPGESTLEELLKRLRQIKENSPEYSEENAGEEESSNKSDEYLLDCLNPFGQTEDGTSGQRENQSWEETRQINSDSNDSAFSLPVNSKPNNGSPNPENEYVASTKYPRAYKMKNSQSPAENIQSESTFIGSPGSEQSTTEALIHGPVTRGQRRARSRRPDHRGTRARTESLAPNIIDERLQRFHSRLRYPNFEPLVNETENSPRFPHQETSRQQITGLELQTRGLAAASGTSGALEEESSPDRTNDGESWRLGQRNPTIPPNPELGQVCPRAHSQRHSIAIVPDLRIEIPNDTVTLESEQGGLGHESRAENIQAESTFIGSPASEQSTTEALMHGPVTRGQQRARSRRPDHWGTRARTESPAPNIIDELLERFHYSLRDQILQPLANETENFPWIPHQETSREQITGLELQTRGLAAASGTSGALHEESSPGTTNDGESCRLGEINPTIPPNPEVGQVCPRAHSQRDSRATRIQLTCEIPKDTVSLESEQGGLGNIFPLSEHPDARAYNTENSQSPAENIHSESMFIGSPGSEQITARNARIPSLHILLTTGFNDIPCPPIQSTLRQTVTGSSDLSDSDLSESDTDLVHSVSSLSPDMEREESLNETDASDAMTPSDCNSNPSSDFYSTSTLISSSGSNYMSNFNPTSMPSSSSRDEDSEINSVIFEGSNNISLPPGSLSETRQENRSLSPVTFDYGDSWDQFYPVFYDSDDQWTGLPKAQIDNLAIRSFGEGDALQSCAICITEYTEGNKVRILPCTHEFHVDCVDRWLSKNSTCPICHKEVAYSAQRQNSD